MTSQTRTTVDHDEIRKWAQAHQGRPATVNGTEEGSAAGILRLDFPGGAGSDKLTDIDWDEWFDKFDAADLAFIYQEEKSDGSDSTFFKLIERD